MTASETTPSTNGVVRISRKGIVLFAFGDDPPFQVDVVAIHDEWLVIDGQFRDDKGLVPEDRLLAYNDQKKAFVESVIQKAYAGGTLPSKLPIPIITYAEAFEFIAKIFEETEKLRVFFVPRGRERPSAPENTEVRFSQ